MPNWKPEFRAMGAVYERTEERADAPHIKALKSDTHTNVYFNSDVVERDIEVTTEIAEQQADVLLDRGEVPEWVIGHAPYAIIPAQALAVALHGRGLTDISVGYAMRNDKGGYGTTFDVRPGQPVTAIADDVVSGDSTRKTIDDLVTNKGAVVLDSIPCYANLSGQPDLDGRPFVAASTFDREAYRLREDRCVLCAFGSTALQPRANWPELQRWMQSYPPG